MPDWHALVLARLAEAGLDPATEAEITEELTQHVADRYRELCASGIPESEAVAGSLRELDGHEHLVRDLVRLKQASVRLRPDDMPRSHSWLVGLTEDTRYAIRRLLQRPGASLTSVLTLACSIGAGAATWSLLSATLLHPLAIAAPDRLVVVGTREEAPRESGTLRNPQIYPIFMNVRDSGVFDDVAGSGSRSLLVASGGIPQKRIIDFVSRNYFDLLGVKLPIGRGFESENDRRGAPPVAVLSDRFWRRELGADVHVLGREIFVAGKTATVVGIAPRSFRGLNLTEPPDLYMPLHAVGDVVPYPTNFFGEPNTRYSPSSWITVIGRLHPNSDAAEATAHLDGLSPLQGRRSTSSFGLTNVNTATIPEAARPGMAQFGRLLAITVGLLLLIGCMTVGMLLLIRTEARQNEFAMCLALGASRARLARGVAIEGALLSFAGAALAMPVAWWLFDGVRAFQLPGGVDIDLLDLSIDARALLAAVGGAIVATLLIAAVAGVFGFTANIADVLRSRTGGSPRVTRRRTRTVLVAGQVAVALVLLSGAGLFARSLIAALRLNPGFETSRVVTGSLSLGDYGYTPIRAMAFFDDLRERLSTNPAIRSVSLTEFGSGMGPGGQLVIDGVPRRFPSEVEFSAIDQRYFSTMGIRMLEGRDLSNADTDHAPLVAVVSASFGRQMSNGGNPIGQRITMPYHVVDQPAPVIEVVGVVPDVIIDVNTLEPLVMYRPIAQLGPGTYRNIVLRASTDADAARREAMSTIKQLNAAIAMSPMQTIDERIGRQMSPQRFGALVLGALGVIAALLTVLGTYVLAESMAILRMREMGIRAALGATGRQLGTLVLAETGRLVGLGLAAGLLLAWLMASTIRAFLFHVEPLDPATLASVAGAILALALVVSLRPAWRAAHVDLGRVLREE